MYVRVDAEKRWEGQSEYVCREQRKVKEANREDTVVRRGGKGEHSMGQGVKEGYGRDWVVCGRGKGRERRA